MKRISYDTFYRYDDMLAYLRDAADSHPQRVKLTSLAGTPEGRGVWLAEVTDQSTGQADEKPAYYVQAGLHAPEGAGTTAALHLLRTQLTSRKWDALLRDVAFYIVPRVNPDGIEYALTTRAPIRSRLLPDQRVNGLSPRDLNGDGHILSMRWEDPAGPMREDEEDPRILVRREPGETEGPFYQVCTEGLIHDYDGGSVVAGTRSIDFNRNFAAKWEPIGVSADYPFSEVETRAVGEFTLSHPNIFAGVDFHCGTNAILRLTTKSDSEIDQADLGLILEIGRLAADTTGLPLMSVRDYGDAWRTPQTLPGCSEFWAYYQLGISFYVIELGNGFNSAGITAQDYFASDAKTKATVFMRRVLKCHDDHGSELFAPWQPFEHPQLGRVEIGGILHGMGYYMYPPSMKKVIPKTTQFVLQHAQRHPNLTLTDVATTVCGGGVHRVRATIANLGGFSTQVMSAGGIPSMRRPVRVELKLAEGMELLSRTPVFELGSLGDRGGSAKVEWFVKAPDGGTVTVDAHHPRAGRAVADLRL